MNIALEENEVLLRVFFRIEVAETDQLEIGDFERRVRVGDRDPEPGLSLFRENVKPVPEILSTVAKMKKREFRGFARTTPAKLRNAGFRLLPPESSGHVTLRCRPCDEIVPVCGLRDPICGLWDPTSDERLELLSHFEIAYKTVDVDRKYPK